jgi:hypothetical protein
MHFEMISFFGGVGGRGTDTKNNSVINHNKYIALLKTKNKKTVDVFQINSTIMFNDQQL